MYRTILVLALLLPSSSRGIDAADRPIKVFVLAGQSNMVGWGDSLKLEDDLRNGNGRVLMFENGNWQPLKPFQEVKRTRRSLAWLNSRSALKSPSVMRSRRRGPTKQSAL